MNEHGSAGTARARVQPVFEHGVRVSTTLPNTSTVYESKCIKVRRFLCVSRNAAKMGHDACFERWCVCLGPFPASIHSIYFPPPPKGAPGLSRVRRRAAVVPKPSTTAVGEGRVRSAARVHEPESTGLFYSVNTISRALCCCSKTRVRLSCESSAYTPLSLPPHSPAAFSNPTSSTNTPPPAGCVRKVPLQGAAAEGDLTMVETLIKAGASSSGERERDGQTPLHAAAEGGRYVLRRQEGMNCRALLEFCGNQPQQITEPLSTTALHAQQLRTTTSPFSCLLLQPPPQPPAAATDAAKLAPGYVPPTSLDVVMALLRRRARRDVNKSTRGSRETPLFCAVKHGHADIAQALVRADADVDLADAHGEKRRGCISLRVKIPVERAEPWVKPQRVHVFLCTAGLSLHTDGGGRLAQQSRTAERNVSYHTPNGTLRLKQHNQQKSGMRALSRFLHMPGSMFLRQYLPQFSSPRPVSDGVTQKNDCRGDSQRLRFPPRLS